MIEIWKLREKIERIHSRDNYTPKTSRVEVNICFIYLVESNKYKNCAELFILRIL
jgi:hypothetical protein